jgi:biopolymer transport protein TolQ
VQPHIAQTGVLELVAEAGPVAKLVLLILLGASVFCWAIIFTKWRSLATALSENAKFLNVFWHGKNIDEIMTKTDKFPRSPVAAVFKSGVRELKKLSAAELAAATGNEKVENIYRALVRASNSEIAGLEKHVSWLATTASAAPFVGLFGTVWGIMNSFQSIGASGSANLAVVAPGISEALITTATGIGAAIPAVIAYNHFAGQIKRLSVDMDCFSQDFLNIIQRSVLGGRKGT